MASEGSVTHWIGQLQAGDPAAAQPLWERYFLKLVHLARRKLQGLPRRAADEEDVALSAFDSFCRAAEARRFPALADRDGLWRLLVKPEDVCWRSPARSSDPGARGVPTRPAAAEPIPARSGIPLDSEHSRVLTPGGVAHTVSKVLPQI
jgi:hypothetical protein